MLVILTGYKPGSQYLNLTVAHRTVAKSTHFTVQQNRQNSLRLPERPSKLAWKSDHRRPTARALAPIPYPVVFVRSLAFTLLSGGYAIS